MATAFTPFRKPITHFGPDEIALAAAALEDALNTLHLADRRNDPATNILAKRIIELATQGERDPIRLKERALETLLA